MPGFKRDGDLVDGYLYSFWTGRLIEYKGVIKRPVILEDGKGQSAIFRSTAGPRKRFLCAARQEEVYNSVVWLEKPNEGIARALLATHYLITAAIHKEKMENALNKAHLLSEGDLK